MEGNLDRVLARRLGRRDFLRYSAILGGAGVLAACKKAETSGAGTPGSPRPPVSEEPGDLQIFDWAGYEVKPLWRPYANQFPGQTPRWTTYKDDQFGYSKIAVNPDAVDFDVVHPCHYYWSDYVKLTRSDGSPVLQPWDTSLIQNFSQLNPAFIPGGQFDGQQYFVPVDWGLAAPLYRPDKVEPTEDSWGLLWDERYKG
jgi:spermidine/putrescine-binding protein